MTIEFKTDGRQSIQSIAPTLWPDVQLKFPRAMCTFFGHDQDLRATNQKPALLEHTEEGIRALFLWQMTEKQEQLLLEVFYRPEGDGLRIETRIINETSMPIYLVHVDPLVLSSVGGGDLQLGQATMDWRIFRHGWQSWSATRFYRSNESDPRPRFDFLVEMEENPTNPSPNEVGVFASEQVTAVANVAEEKALALGFLTCRDAYGDIRLEVDHVRRKCRLLRARLNYDGIRVEADQTIVGETLWLSFGNKPAELLENWAAVSGRAMRARVPAKPPVGWCSWYYYFTKVSQKALLDNLEKLAPLRQSMNLDLFQLDDGYQAAIGDWLIPNAKFPDGLAGLPAKIAAAGFMPGIWTAPFLVAKDSVTAREHPDWLLRGAGGKPIRGAYNPNWSLTRSIQTLDPTHPGVQEWLENTFRTLRAMGWRFFKIDFLYAASLPANRHDAALSRAGALRVGLEAIRRGAGEDAVILGCGCPCGPAVGLVDIMRIGPDVTPRWTNPMRPLFHDHHCLSTRHAVRNTIQRAFLDRRWWLNDPDCVLARDKKNRLTLAEIQTFAALAAVSGGLFLISDDMTEYPPERLALLQTAIRHRTEGMRVLDPEKGEFPQKMIARTPGGVSVLLLNHENRPVDLAFDLREAFAPSEPPADIAVTDIWTGEKPKVSGSVCLCEAVPPHGCRWLDIQPATKSDTHA